MDGSSLPRPDAKQLLEGLQQTLAAVGCDYKRIVDEFGQVRASEQRAQGKTFQLADHVRGLILSLLSNQRQWGPTAQNLDRIDRIFFHYNPDAIKAADPNQLKEQLMAIRCGNRQIAKQMATLAGNIAVFAKIEAEYGSLDRFVVSADPHDVAMRLSAPGKFKLRQIGYALGMEYLRNVGVRASKPDVHIRRAIGRLRLGLVDAEDPSEEQAYRTMGEVADNLGINSTYLDNLLWLFCAKDYGDVCGAAPRCTVCLLRDNYHYPVRPAAS
jgi:hypothetical protein